MKEILLQIQGGILIGCMFGLGVIVLAVFLSEACKCWRDWMRQRHALILTAAALVGLVVGGTKHGSVTTGGDLYINVSGSYVTNDFVHVEVQKRYEWLPDTTAILIYSRELSQTNAEDWVRVTRIEEGDWRIIDFPLDIAFPNATNYNFLVASNYVPEPTVHTNGVWTARGFIVDTNGVSSMTGAFPFSRIKLED